MKRTNFKPAKPVVMWAVVVKRGRSHTINKMTLRDTKRECRERYIQIWGRLIYQDRIASGLIRLARVIVAEEGGK